MKNFYNIYLLLISALSIIIIAICFATISTSVGKFIIISDNEYVIHSYSYSNQNCESKSTNTKSIINAKEEIDKCKNEQINQTIQKRHYKFKDDLIGNVAWLFSFIILFGIHYPLFRKNKYPSKQ